MPSFVTKHHGIRQLAYRQFLYSLLENLRLHSLPLAIEFAQTLRKSQGLFRVLGQEQIHGQLDLTDAAGRIDPGRQHKADGGGADVLRCAAAFGHQRSDAGPTGILQRLQATGHEGSVFSHQGHHIGHCAQADHIGIFCQGFFLVSAEGGSQFEGHTHAGQIHMWVAAVGPMGVDDGAGIRQHILTLVVVGDHQVHTQLSAQLCFFHSGNAAVDGDDQAHAFAGQLPDGDGIQTVAFFQTAGDIADAICAPGPQEVGQQAGGGNSVHIVITEDGDLFSPAERQPHPTHGQVHVRQGKGTGQGIVTAEIMPGLGRGGQATGGQDHSGQGSVSAGNQGVDGSHIRGL